MVIDVFNTGSFLLGIKQKRKLKNSIYEFIVKLAIKEEVKIYGDHSYYHTWRGKYYRALQLLYDVYDHLDPNTPVFTQDDLKKAYQAGVDNEQETNGCGHYHLDNFLEEEYNIFRDDKVRD